MKFLARTGETEREVEVLRHGNSYRVRVGERWIDVDLVKIGKYVRSLRLDDGTQFACVPHVEGNTYEISFGGAAISVEIADPLASKRRRRDDDIGGVGVIKALMPGRVVRLLVEKGAAVRKGTGLLILEAMKMENEIVAAADGTVEEFFVESGQTVEAGADLVHIV